MEQYNNVSLDIETLGREPGCVVLSIGVTPFNVNRVEDFGTLLKRSKHWAIDRTTMTDYLVDLDTLAWHMNNPERASMLDWLDSIAKPLNFVMIEFFDYLTQFDQPHFWANSPDFDCAILERVFAREKLPIPWHFTMKRDVRTALHLRGINKRNIKPGGFVPHRADHDAAYQAHLVQLAFRR